MFGCPRSRFVRYLHVSTSHVHSQYIKITLSSAEASSDSDKARRAGNRKARGERREEGGKREKPLPDNVRFSGTICGCTVYGG